ncbi:uncharacterized protein PV09_02711 [Verruconis gallopava]|uniref:Uncharacterized protein n=1 Tax=Verruconis gallopava TaxID=253628 RepID=A0A0D1YZV1_9PEZI|nr:uncharacterized protein PV09_02711 [Verruconis gallopava]KIW06237.1 hypothetical protein PV09_02711 [Verruconis gallopava]
MRTSSILLALPALALAETQARLGFLDKIKAAFETASSYIPSAIPSVIPDPVDAGAAKVAARAVHQLTLDNWESTLSSERSEKSTGPEQWMVYLTGGNKTCYGLCNDADAAWNKSAAVLAVSPDGPHLATVDCEQEMILCNAWAAGPPSIYYFLIPQPLPDQTKPATTVHYIPLNRTSVTAIEITELYTKQKYAETAPYEGYFHPFDSPLVKFGVIVPMAYVMWGFSKMPSWLPMVLVSFLSRTFMGRRLPQAQGGAQGRGAPAPAAQ